MERPHRTSLASFVLQGEISVSDQEGLVLSALLGSCVAACVHDPATRIGGMTHFLLPGADPNGTHDKRYGAHAMAELIRQMLRAGAYRKRLQMSLFGGGNVLAGLPQIGDANSAFAQNYVSDNGMLLHHKDLGGTRGRRLRFLPACGSFDVQLMDIAGSKHPMPAQDGKHF